MPPHDSETPLGRYARILEVVAAAPDGLNLSAIAELTGLQAGTSHRLVNSLCEVGFLARPNGRKIYVLGERMIHLCLQAVTPATVITIARPILRDLVRQHAETAYLARLAGGTVESIALEVPQGGEKSHVQPGRVMPFHASASAKAIYAFQTADVVERLLAEPRAPFTPDTRIDEAEIRRDLALARAQRFAVCDNELDPGVLSLAAPVIQKHGVVFAVGLVGLSARLRLKSRDAIRESLLRASEELARRLQPGSGADPASPRAGLPLQP